MDKARGEKKKYLFTVDILIEGYSNGIALETLLHLLNQDKIADYDIRHGIALGQTIRTEASHGGAQIRVPDKATSAAQGKAEQAKPGEADNGTERNGTARAGRAKAEPPKQEPIVAEAAKPPYAPTASSAGPETIELLEKYKQSNALVRLTVLKGKGIRLSLPCRILNFDPQTDSLTVYHVDEKKVYQFRMTEVEEFST